MAIKDFSITLQRISSQTGKKDVGIVTGFNAISQYIEHICKTQKGELTSDVNLGSEYFNYIFSGNSDKDVMEVILAADIAAKLQNITNVKVKLFSMTETLIQFEIFYSLTNQLNKQTNSSCFIEVEL